MHSLLSFMSQMLRFNAPTRSPFLPERSFTMDFSDKLYRFRFYKEEILKLSTESETLVQ